MTKFEHDDDIFSDLTPEEFKHVKGVGNMMLRAAMTHTVDRRTKHGWETLCDFPSFESAVNFAKAVGYYGDGEWRIMYHGGEDEPTPADRDALADALIAWAADEDNVIAGDFLEYCVLCGEEHEPHAVDCLHLRARALLEAQ